MREKLSKCGNYCSYKHFNHSRRLLDITLRQEKKSLLGVLLFFKPLRFVKKYDPLFFSHLLIASKCNSLVSDPNHLKLKFAKLYPYHVVEVRCPKSSLEKSPSEARDEFTSYGKIQIWHLFCTRRFKVTT